MDGCTSLLTILAVLIIVMMVFVWIVVFENVRLGQMICDDQYGEGVSSYLRTVGDVIECTKNSVENDIPFDGGKTRLVEI